MSYEAWRRWYDKNEEVAKQEARVRARKWRAANRERHLAYVRVWISQNRNKHNSYCKKWDIENRSKRLISHYRRRRRIYISDDASPGIVKQLWVKQGGLCANRNCGVDFVFDKYHLDHIMPLALGGKHEDTNLQLLCPKCNQSKGAKHPNKWIGNIPLV